MEKCQRNQGNSNEGEASLPGNGSSQPAVITAPRFADGLRSGKLVVSVLPHSAELQKTTETRAHQSFQGCSFWSFESKEGWQRSALSDLCTTAAWCRHTGVQTPTQQLCCSQKMLVDGKVRDRLCPAHPDLACHTP